MKQTWTLAIMMLAATIFGTACQSIDTTPINKACGVQGTPCGKTDDGNANPQLDRLIEIFSADGAFTYPPVGVAYNANDLRVKFEIIDAKSTMDLQIKNETPLFLNRFQIRGKTLFALMTADIHVSIRSGFLDSDILDTLCASMTTPEAAAESRQLMQGLAGNLLHLEAFDIGAEIVGLDVFIFIPYGQQQGLRIELAYVQA